MITSVTLLLSASQVCAKHKSYDNEKCILHLKVYQSQTVLTTRRFTHDSSRYVLTATGLRCVGWSIDIDCSVCRLLFMMPWLLLLLLLSYLRVARSNAKFDWSFKRFFFLIFPWGYRNVRQPDELSAFCKYFAFSNVTPPIPTHDHRRACIQSCIFYGC